jgi:hypothetical protein
MDGEIVRRPQGSFTVKFLGNVSDISRIDELKTWARSRDIELRDPDEDKIDYKKAIKTAAQQNPRRKEKEALKNPRVLEFWHRWYDVLKEKYPEIAKPERLDTGELRFVKTILDEYGDQLTLEIFKVAVYDWDALRTLHNKLPPAPTLSNVLYHRRELSIGVTSGGITTSKQRVSEYRQSKDGDTSSDWNIKKQD